MSESECMGVRSGVLESPCISPSLISEPNMKSRTSLYTRHVSWIKTSHLLTKLQPSPSIHPS